MDGLLSSFEQKLSSVNISRMISRTVNTSGECWIDECGHLHFVGEYANNPNFRQPIRPTYEDQGHAFRYLGMAQLKFNLLRIIVRWDVSCVADDAIEGVLNYLDECQFGQDIVLNFYYNGWSTETFSNPQLAIQRIQKVMLYREVVMSKDVLIHKVNIAEVSQSTFLIKRAFGSWERSNGKLPGHQDSEHMSIFEKMLIMVPNQSGDGVIRWHVGRESTAKKVFGIKWTRNAILKGVTSDGPEGRYLSQINTSYMQTILSGVPRLEHIRALIERNGHEPVWFPYHRLLTPTVLLDGTPAVISMTDITERLAIPFMNGATFQ